MVLVAGYNSSHIGRMKTAISVPDQREQQEVWEQWVRRNDDGPISDDDEPVADPLLSFRRTG
jgi:hypothetical protein